jgi:hypothetical protein
MDHDHSSKDWNVQILAGSCSRPEHILFTGGYIFAPPARFIVNTKIETSNFTAVGAIDIVLRQFGVPGQTD